MPDARTHSESFATRVLLDASPDGVFVASRDGYCTYVNPAGATLLGYTGDQLVGRSMTELVAPESLADQAALAHRLQAGQTDRVEWRPLHRDGSRIAVELSACALPDGTLVGFVRDIREWSRLARARHAADAKYAGIVAMSPDAIISVDEARRITLFNHGAEVVFGYAAAEVIGQPISMLLPERCRASHDAEIAAFATGGTTSRPMNMRRRDLVGLRKSGDEFAAEGSISRSEVDGEVMFTVALRDISEQLQRELEDHLLSEIGNVLVTAGPDVKQLFTDVSQAIVRGAASWCTITALEDKRVTRVRMAHSDPTLASLCAALEKYPPRFEIPGPTTSVALTGEPLLVTEVPPGFEVSVAQDEEHLELLRQLDPGSLLVVPLIARGQTLGTLTLGESRGARRLGERDLELAEHIASRVALALDNARLFDALSRALRARDEVLGVVAHDLRAPLNAIVLHAQSLRRRRDPANERDVRIAEQIHSIAMRMNGLVSDLLEVGRLEAGQKLAVHPAPVAPAGILSEAIEIHAPVLEANDHRLALDAQADLPDVFADRARIVQILDNLLGNANKFARSHVTLGAVRKDDSVLFRVTDDGPGIPAPAKARVFDPFWQASSDRRGAGLGLSIVKGLVDAHGGRIWIDSEPGAGTSVCFTVPVA